MADEVPIPFVTSPNDVLEAGDGHNVLRLEEIAEELDVVRSDLYKPLMELVERGEVAVFPVGESVQVRFDTDG
jgi:DNA-binding IclR family transcriptional regulator